MALSMKPKPQPTLADRLRQLRHAAGLSQAQLAQTAGVSLRFVTDLEQGRRSDPGWTRVQRLADALGVSTELLRT